MPRGIYVRKPRQSSYPVKSRLHCKKCSYVWKYEGISSSTHCPICGEKKDARDKTTYTEAYIKLHPERKDNLIKWVTAHRRENYDRSLRETKKRVMAIVTKSQTPRCSDCGCSDTRLLELNHVNGGGGKEYHSKGASSLYRDIVALRRTVDDLNILCRVCNAKHYLELKFGKLPIEVKWNGL